MTPYDPIESLREEVNRFHNTNALDPLSVTLFYTQAKVVLAEMDELREENKRLRDQLSTGLCSIHQIPEPLRCRICNKVHEVEGRKRGHNRHRGYRCLLQSSLPVPGINERGINETKSIHPQ